MGLSVSKNIEKSDESEESPGEILANAEAIDGYWAAISKDPVNSLARDAYTYKEFVGETVLSTEDYDTSGIFPKGRIITMMPSAEAGFPHTRGKNVICIPAYFPEHAMPTVIVHELIHLHQKDMRIEYEEFYRKYWDFSPIDEKMIPENIRNRRRLNPDTIGWPTYIWRNTWIPLCLFEREDRPNMRDCKYCWYDPYKNILRYSAPPAWIEFFGNVDGTEHPNELSAYYGSEVEKYKTLPGSAARLFYAFLFTHKNSSGGRRE